MKRIGQHAQIGFVVLLLAAAFSLMLAGIIDPRGQWRPWDGLLTADEDGSWAALSIDGRPVDPQQYRIAIADGEVSGGRDGCNSWGYSDEAPDANGERTIVTTLVGCPEDDPVRQAYWRLASASRIALLPDGRLRLSADGHEAIFRRCEWKTERESGPGYSSERMVCV